MQFHDSKNQYTIALEVNQIYLLDSHVVHVSLYVCVCVYVCVRAYIEASLTQEL